MNWIFLSPHLDDIAFSCGGLVRDLTDNGDIVEIWTICAGDPPVGDLSPLANELHRNWGLGLDAVKVRREEDQNACQIIGAIPRSLDYLDCIYRKSSQGDFYYTNESDIFGGLDPLESDLIKSLSKQLREELPKNAKVVAPLGIGNHVDHELTRKAINRLDIPILFYADYPYAREENGKEILNFMEVSFEWQSVDFTITAAGLESWIQAAGVYRSQFSTFWEEKEDLEQQIREFRAFLGGYKLWKAIEDH